jgi:hypothetical protein
MVQARPSSKHHTQPTSSIMTEPAYAQLFGQFDFNRTPLAPPGTRILSHDKLVKRASWATHGEEGWYLGPSMEHYRCYHVFINKTKAERDSDTVSFFQSKTTMPALSSTDRAMRAAAELTQALLHPHPSSPLAPIGTEQLQALEQLSSIFSTAAPRVKAANSSNKAATEKSNPSKTHGMQTRLSEPAHAINQVTLQPPRPREPQPSLAQLQHDIDNTVNLPTTPRTVGEWLDCLHFANAVAHPVTGKLMEYRELIVDPATKPAWTISSANEFGRLAQGIRDIPGTNTIFFIHQKDVPNGRTCTYLRFVCLIRPQKEEANRTRITVGGNLIDYPGEKSTRTAGLTTVKCLINSIISKPNAKAHWISKTIT